MMAVIAQTGHLAYPTGSGLPKITSPSIRRLLDHLGQVSHWISPRAPVNPGLTCEPQRI